MTPTGGLLGGLRGVSLGVVGLALFAHLTAGGAAPGPAALLPPPVPARPRRCQEPNHPRHPRHPRHRVVHRRPRILATVLAAGALLVGAASTAEAHDSLLGSSPAAGSTPVVVPARVTLTLSEPAISVGTIVIVTGPAGPVQSGAPALVDNTITQRLQPRAPAGEYTVTWRATSSDGHPVSGTFSFTAARASTGGMAVPGTPAMPATPTASTPSAARSASVSSGPASTAPAAATSGASHLWGLLAGSLVVLLLLGMFLVRLKPRSTPRGERDPR